ncbi:hypothetical protein ACFL29_01905 [Patescibacteria group bacterium]
MEMPEELNREEYRQKASDYVKELKRKTEVDGEFGDIFLALSNILGHFDFDPKEIGTTKEELEEFGQKYFGV